MSLKKLQEEGLIMNGNNEDLIIERIPIGIPALDNLLGGGLPKGRCILSYGPESTGKTLIGQMACKAIQGTDKPFTLLMDMENSYDERWWKAWGIDTEKVWVSSPSTGEEAVNIITAVLEGSNQVGLILVDSIAAMTPAGMIEKAADERTVGLLAQVTTRMYSKIKHPVFMQDIVFMATNQMRDNIGGYDELNALPGGRAQRHISQIILKTRRESWIKEDDEPVGFYIEITSKKNKTCTVPDGTAISLPFLARGQIDMLTNYIEDAISRKIIRRKGPYYYLPDVEQGLLGKPALREFFNEDPGRVDILKQILTATPA